MDANDYRIVVEIDETKYFHRKYDCGQWRESILGVLRGILEDDVSWLRYQIDAIQLIQRPGSTRFSYYYFRQLAAYANINRINNGVFQHIQSLCIINIVSLCTAPDYDENVHTTNLHEFVLRNCFCNENFFNNYVATLADPELYLKYIL